jgi:hypothetical protein
MPEALMPDAQCRTPNRGMTREDRRTGIGIGIGIRDSGFGIGIGIGIGIGRWVLGFGGRASGAPYNANLPPRLSPGSRWYALHMQHQRLRAPIQSLLLAIACACGDGDSEPSPDAAPGAEPDAAPSAVSEQTLDWAAELIRTYDRTIAASCECLVSANGFASLEDCMAALGSTPEWLECATGAIEMSDAGFMIDEANALCMIDAGEARAACLEEASCEPEAMTACLDMPGMPETCPALDNDLVVLLLEKCPDLGLLSRVP